MKKIKLYTVIIPAALLMLSGCNGGSAPRATSDSVYGRLISSSVAPVNSVMIPMMANGMLSMESAESQFSRVILCSGEVESSHCQQNIAYINAHAESFGLEEVNGAATYLSDKATAAGVGGVKFDAITYNTPGVPYAYANAPANETVSGLVILPTDANGNLLPANRIKGVVLYYHQTVISKGGVPSGYSNHSSIDDAETFATQYRLAAIYGMSGYIVVAPDYIGQGVDVNTVHPYAVFPKQNALSGIYMVKAVDTFLQNQYNFNFTQMTNPNLYIASYSEGGGYALKASQLIQTTSADVIANTGLTLKRTVGSSGAYDLSGTMTNFMFAEVKNQLGADPNANPWSVSPGCDPSEQGGNGLCDDAFGTLPDVPGVNQVLAQYQMASGKPVLTAYLTNALINYYFAPSAYKLFYKPDFANFTNCLNFAGVASPDYSLPFTACSNLTNGVPYKIWDIFNNNGLNALQIATLLVAGAAGTENFLIGPNRDVLSLILDEGVGNNTYNNSNSFAAGSVLQDKTMLNLISLGNTYNWTTSSPITIINLKYDSIVPKRNSDIACGRVSGMPGIQTTNPNDLNCIELDNSQMWSDITLTDDFVKPEYLNHGNAEAVVNMIALHQMENTP
ncbi:MAG: hypothetical protein ORN24_02820 [Burkholderiales bacterium]|jgi:hypothetical protein|nr:hypothetical protein [Burkholderiales bacterium]